MIVVDTSVWVDLLRGTESRQADRCAELVTDGAPIALTEVVYAELLQGAPSEPQARRLDEHLRIFPVLRLDGLADFALAAELARKARAAGKPVGQLADCLIAAPCVRTGASLLHSDAHFDRLAECTALTIFAA